MYAAYNLQNIAGVPDSIPQYYMLFSSKSKKNLADPGKRSGAVDAACSAMVRWLHGN
jgi:hypothetical protein